MNAQQSRRILVTSALPYANGSIHLGHLVEYIQTDIWVRFKKMQNHEVYYVCADDTHGTPIMLKAQAEGIAPEELIERVSQEHQRDFADFLVNFDHYYSTNSPENKSYCETIYNALFEKNLIEKRPVEQFYDPKKEMFLPDRFIKGDCPKCSAKEQYGDNCEVCGATYQPTELNNAYSVVSGATPIRKSSDHYFFKLSDPRCEQFLRQWTQNNQRLQPEAAKKMLEWLGQEGDNKLADWDISRDAPYFGFEIPNAPGKYFYVWLDAPVGYFASFKALCDKINQDPNTTQKINIDDFLRADSDCDMVHFIGKDILYFHALFWPAMLEFSGMRTPTQVNAHGFLTVDGAKMSKSRGTFITAESFIQQKMNPEWLRYYFAAKLNASTEDIDLSFADFSARVNSDLVGKYINIASRTSGFLVKHFDGKVNNNTLNAIRALTGKDHEIIQAVKHEAEQIAQLYDAREYGKAIRLTMAATDHINAYIDSQKPWDLARQEDQKKALHEVCSISLEAFRILTLYLKPVLPKLAEQVEQLLGIPPLKWAHLNTPLTSETPIKPFKHLMQRVEAKQIEALINANKQTTTAVANTKKATSESEEELEHITIDDFSKIDLRVGKVLDCQTVEGSKKLLQLTVDCGEEKPRNIFSGIAAYYKPEDLSDKMVIVVANLKPRTMKFGVSEGMVLSGSCDKTNTLSVLTTLPGAKPGMKVG